MEIELDKASGVPIYLQVKRQVAHFIAQGIWQDGDKLPTERELAEVLGISRNTVSAAYRELEHEGVLVCQQGKGTFVAPQAGQAAPDGKKERVLRLIDLAIESTLEMGLGLEEFITLSQLRAREKMALLGSVRVVFVECNREQLDYFAKELELGSGVAVVPLLLERLQAGDQQVTQTVAEADLIVTTFFHLDEVRRLLPGKEILGIALDPQLATIVRIARLPKGRRVALVCLSQSFAERVWKSIGNAGIEALELITTTTRDEDRLRSLLEKVDAVVVSPGRKREVEGMVGPDLEVIEFIYVPDAGSINLLKSTLIELKRVEKG
ncbi:MAG: GntR family transcriptional regulator [Bacillota bacterium]